MNDQGLIRFDLATGMETGPVGITAHGMYTSDLTTNGDAVYITGIGGAYRIDCR